MIIMSKYNPLWKWINKNKTDDFKLTFAEIENIAGVPIDHSFLTFKKELLQYAGCRENGRKILLHYANIDCVLLRTEVSKQKR